MSASVMGMVHPNIYASLASHATMSQYQSDERVYKQPAVTPMIVGLFQIFQR